MSQYKILKLSRACINHYTIGDNVKGIILNQAFQCVRKICCQSFLIRSRFIQPLSIKPANRGPSVSSTVQGMKKECGVYVL